MLLGVPNGRRVQHRARRTASAQNAGRRPSIPAPDPDSQRIDLTLGPEARGLRLDRALADRLPEHSRSVVAGWIRAGRVEIEGAPRAGKTRVEGGEAVVIWVPPPRPTHLEPQDIPLDVLYEDEVLLVIAKPTGLTVHPGAGQRSGTLANALAWHMQNLPELGGADRPGIVHRLDKETSGVMVVARTESAQRALAAAFAEREVRKVYLAAVHGLPDDDRGEIDAAIGRAPNHRTKMAVRPERGRDAFTAWEVARRMPRHSLLRCHPRTGRTHQIRVHLKHMGHPIVGDPTYGRRGAPGEEHAPRLLLHAWRIGFRHPGTGESVSFEAPLPQDFQTALDALAALEPPRRRR